MTEQIRRVACELVVDVVEPVRVSLQVAPCDEFPGFSESMQITSGGDPVASTTVPIPGMSRVHVFSPPLGRLEIAYSATVTGRANLPKVADWERIVYLRPSRYAESDRLAPMAQSEFGGITDPGELVAAVSSWVGTRLEYVSGSSGPTDGAVDTMLHREGVCRDFAHLAVALLRALDVPARLAAVYAPGLDPMDFHAVAEAAIGDTWHVVDATLLAPRSTLVRISSGRDAADTAFLSTTGGQADLVDFQVIATVDGALPSDDVRELVSIT